MCVCEPAQEFNGVLLRARVVYVRVIFVYMCTCVHVKLAQLHLN